jgi:putative salt-induced outer membrane protein YdiY
MPDGRAYNRRVAAWRAAALAAILTITLGAAAPAARADVVTLRNGDRLTGKVVHKSADELAFATAYAGTLKLKWSDIASLSTDGPVTLIVGNGAPQTGALAAGSAPGKASMVPVKPGPSFTEVDAAREIALADVRFVNPTVDESGSGILWSGRINAGGGTTSGNSTNSTLHGDVDLTGRALHYRVLGGGEYNYATSNHVLSVSNWRARAEFDRFYRQNFFSYTRATFEHDRFKSLDLRSTAGGGLGYQFFESPALNLSLQAGVDYVAADNIGAPDDHYAAAAWVLRYDQKPWGLNLQLFHQQEGTISMDSAGNVVLHTRTGVRAPLGGGINATLQYNYDWTRDPPPGSLSADRTLLFTLGYAW